MSTFAKYFGVSCLIGGVFIFLVNLPLQLVRDGASAGIKVGQGEYGIRDDARPLPVAAGWPETFYRCYDDVPSVEPFVFWSTSTLLRNVGVGFVVCFAFAFVVFQLKLAKKAPNELPDEMATVDVADSTPNKGRWRRLLDAKVRYSISDIILLTLICALPLGYYQWQRRLYDIDLQQVSALGPDADCVRETIMPGFLGEWTPFWLIPVSLRGAMQRATVVRLNDPNDAQVRVAMSLPHLRGLIIGGGEYDLELLASLPNRDALTVLHLTGRELNDTTLSRIRLMDNLRSLSFHRTNMSHTAVERLFADRPVAAARLKAFNLVDSGVDLEGLSDSKALASMVSLESLYLPRPIPGNEADFTLPPLPKLSELSFGSQDRGKNASVMKVTIADCPELVSLSIGDLQKSSLKLTRLPKLKTISPSFFLTTLRLAANQSTPGGNWIESIVVDDLPQFEALKFYASDLKEMRFTKTPSFRRLGPGVYQVAADGFSVSSTYDEKVPDDATKALVQGLAQSDGPEVIDYSAVPLGRADLAPLLTNPRLSELYLHSCGLKVDDVKKLLGSQTLRVISTQGNELENIQIGQLISQLPKLERWHGDLYSLDRLKIEDHQHIQGVVDSLPEESGPDRCHLAHCSAIRLVNLSRWVDPIRLDADSFRHITIQNLPNLPKLIINGPICDNTVLSGLSGLHSIAIGGSAVNDGTIADWSSYVGLKSIGLYGTSISAAGYRKLLDGRSLTRIDLRQARIDDAAILTFDPTQLVSVSLIDTDVTEVAVRHVLKSTMLAELNVSGIMLSADLRDRILGMRALTALSFNATGWTPEQIGKVALMPTLTHLSIDHIHLDKSVYAAISSSGWSGITRLTLIDSTVDGPALDALMKHFPNLKLEAVRTDIPVVLEVDLIAADRVILEFQSEDVPYCRGPEGMKIAIMKQPQANGGIAAQSRMSAMMMGMRMMSNSGMSNSQSFEAMSEEQFDRLSPAAFEVFDVVEAASNEAIQEQK